MNLTIGLDAGGTKTTGLILDEHSNILFQVETDFGNPNVHFDQALTNIWSAVSACLASEYGPRCRLIVAGVAGIEAGDNRVKFESFFAFKTDLPAIFVNDAVLAYHAMHGIGEGVLTIAGTGSVSYGRNQENEGYTGGWGHLLGDEGSSYDVAIQVCKQITREYDQGLPHSSLSKVMIEKHGISGQADLKKFIYSSAKAKIASLSYTVYLEAEKGDETAIGYFYQAGNDLANQTASLCKKLNLQAPVKIACKGSLLEKNTYVQTAFKAKLSTLIGETEIIKNDRSPAIGAISVASIYAPKINNK